MGVLLALLPIALLQAADTPAPQTWRAVAEGVEYALIEETLHVVRIDTRAGKAQVRLVTSSKEGVPNRTAGQWADAVGLVVAINAGMFETDHASNVGYMRDGAHVNNGTWNDYQSILAFSANKPVVLADKGTIDPSDFDVVVQNLRLLKGKGENVWKTTRNQKKWSEALAAMDDKGRLLFVFSRKPFVMRDLNDKLLTLGLGIERAMHLEGGPEASLSIRGRDGFKLDLSGSYETGFNENDDNRAQWPIPNVLGVAR